MTTLALPWRRQADAADDAVGWWARRQARRDDRRDAAIDRWLRERDVVDLRFRWRAASVRAGLCQLVNTPLGGHAMADGPRVVHVEPGSYGVDGYLVLEQPPGLTLADLEDGAPELAAALGVWSVAFTQRAARFVRVDLIGSDPLTGVVDWLPDAPPDHIVLGVDEHGAVVSEPLADLTNVLAQGSTRSGKTAFGYSMFAQLAARPDVDLVGIDPTSLLLGPLGPHPRGWRVCGTGNPAAYEVVLAELVREMERRLQLLPPRCDVLPFTPEMPLLVVALEEWAGIGRLLGHSRNKPSQVHKYVARLLGEGSKVGIRLFILVQRGEADLLGVYEREQCLTRLTFGSSDINTLKLLHGDATPELADLHAASQKGVAVTSLPGRALLRLRAPWIGSYGAYVDAVAGEQHSSCR